MLKLPTAHSAVNDSGPAILYALYYERHFSTGIVATTSSKDAAEAERQRCAKYHNLYNDESLFSVETIKATFSLCAPVEFNPHEFCPTHPLDVPPFDGEHAFMYRYVENSFKAGEFGDRRHVLRQVAAHNAKLLRKIPAGEEVGSWWIPLEISELELEKNLWCFHVSVDGHGYVERNSVSHPIRVIVPTPAERAAYAAEGGAA